MFLGAFMNGMQGFEMKYHVLQKVALQDRSAAVGNTNGNLFNTINTRC